MDDFIFGFCGDGGSWLMLEVEVNFVLYSLF